MRNVLAFDLSVKLRDMSVAASVVLIGEGDLTWDQIVVWAQEQKMVSF